jgi:alpha-D-ribose 1-methylphosphonate 5-triphosphate synthase subunit PhnH
VSRSDFLFVLDPTDLAESVSSAKPGTLISPHTGATIIGAVESVEEAGPLSLTGPGIEFSRSLGVHPAPDWVQPRAEKNGEFPMGVDMLLAAANGDVVALPRTTQIAVGR